LILSNISSFFDGRNKILRLQQLYEVM